MGIVDGDTYKCGSFLDVLDRLPVVFYTVQPEKPYRFEYISSGAKKIFDLDAAGLLESMSPWKEILDRKSYTDVQKCFQEVIEHGDARELEIKLVHGSVEYYAYMQVRPYSGSQEGENLFEGMFYDITERKKVEEELNQTQIHQSLGRLVAGIAHEINTPMQFISDNLMFLKDACRDFINAINSQANQVDAECDIDDMDYLREEVPQAIDQSIEGLGRVSAMISAMRDFSKIDRDKKTDSDINRIIENTLIILRNNLKYIANIQCEYDDYLPKIKCYCDDLNQVFLNLLINAGHSIEHIRESNSEHEGLINIRTSVNDRDEVVIEISDNGTGISEEVQKKMFEAFFTTKERGKGTGQGLYITRNIIIEKHKGTIDFETESGVGTKFIIKLPIGSKE